MTNLETRASDSVGDGGSPDGDLLARWCADRDAGALEQLVRRHGGMVLGVCRRVLGNAPDADDAFQATFLVFLQKAGTLTQPEQVAGWLHAVALRVSQKSRANRGRRREREAEIVSTIDPADPTNPDPASDVQDLRRTLDEELDRLPEKYRLPIVLCELEGRTLDEAAQLLGWPKGTVAGRLSRGREFLRQRLSRRGIGLPLFTILPLPAVEFGAPPEPLVSATLASATGEASTAVQPAALAHAVLRDGARRIGLVALLILAVLLAAIGWQTRPASARPSPAPSAVSGGCHAATSP